jgi:hypothetical protein
MPAQYLAMKRKFISEGMSEEDAATKAAKIYNSQHPNDPVGPDYDKAHKEIQDYNKRLPKHRRKANEEVATEGLYEYRKRRKK